MSKLTKAKQIALGKILDSEAQYQLPFQSKAKIYKQLVEEGLAVEDTVILGGRFPVRISGYSLTDKGRLLYCESCG